MPTSTEAVNVSLIEATTILARKGRSIEAHLEQEFAAGDEVVLFEPKLNTLQSQGLSSMESILTQFQWKYVDTTSEFQQSAINFEAGHN